ncbi:DNA polymerase III subunit psi [Vibrio sonorensis]|uniref:DNA polymerase III subunit psi n=1 Tax=Vibrio sonorensis TaxID=1004316 RepID=UPI0008D97B37|nr:DNA polymerase III subunit psi [Vibrio sonorensis]
MSNRDSTYLNEMGIDCYQLIHPQRLEGYQQAKIELDSECELLLVTPAAPQGDTVPLLDNIVKAMALTLPQVRVIAPEQLSQIAEPSLSWVWFCGCESVELPFTTHLVSSPSLTELANNQQEKRALWQQIRAKL